MGNKIQKEDDWSAVPKGIWREKKLCQEATLEKKSVHIKAMLNLLHQSANNGHVYTIQWTRVFMRVLKNENYTHCNATLRQVLNYIFVFLDDKDISIDGILQYATHSKYLLTIGIATRYTIKSHFRVQDEIAMFIFCELEAVNLNFAEHLFQWDNLMKDVLRLGITLAKPFKELQRENYISLVDLLAVFVVYRRLREKTYQNSEKLSCSTPKYAEPDEILREHLRLILRSMSPVSFSLVQSRCEEYVSKDSMLFKECTFSNAVESLENSFPLLDCILGYEVCGLKHLCRLQIRRHLFMRWALPEGIYTLPVPRNIKDYLNLHED